MTTKKRAIRLTVGAPDSDVPIYVDDGTGTGAKQSAPVDYSTFGKSIGQGAAQGGTKPATDYSTVGKSAAQGAAQGGAPPPAPAPTPVYSAPAPQPAPAPAPAPTATEPAHEAQSSRPPWVLPAAILFAGAGVTMIIAGLAKKGRR